MDLKQFLSIDDIAWLSAKIKGEYLGIKLSETLTKSEKHARIYNLVQRAQRFNFKELVSHMGYTIHEIHLPNNRKIELVYPSNLTKDERVDMYNQILRQIEVLRKCLPDPTPAINI
jgi:hypothetical protein